MFSNNLICDILVYINDNLKYKISIQDLEKRFYYNRYYIMKLFKKEIGITITQYINSLKIYNSINDIKNSNNTLTSIALRNGFYSLEYFSETFKQITKLSPKVFKDYFHNNIYISDKNISLIQLSFIKLYNIHQLKDTYLANKKPTKKQVKVLSIFR